MQRGRVYIQKPQLKRYGVRDFMEIKILKISFKWLRKKNV